MFSSESLGGAIAILRLGVIGLGFILALMAFVLLTREQKKSEPHTKIIHALYFFMAFSVVLCGVGLYAQIGSAEDKAALAHIQNEKSSLETKLSDYQTALDIRNEEIGTLKEKVGELDKELTRIKTSSINWDYTANGNIFRCKVNGRTLGTTQDCRKHDTCGDRLLNRAICALLYSHQIWE
jgi:hypothetical protein